MLSQKTKNEILEHNKKCEDMRLSQYACKSIDALHKQKLSSGKEDIRGPFFHDIDKIIHSKAYSRYIDKTQVFYLFENDHITHRVLHVQFVSKIGRTIGRCLKLNEDLIEAMALGHDLGHTPYGHDGERILDRLCQKHNAGHFAHNAQSVRALRDLANKGKGINLSLQTLDGILNHNGELPSQKYYPDYNKTWEQFEEEFDSFYHKNKPKYRPMTLEGCVVRISDIIAYIGRDIEDAILVNLIKREDIPKEITDIVGNSNKTIINTFVNDLIENSFDKDYLSFSDEVYNALVSLKKFNFDKIYTADVIKTDYEKIKNIFGMLFDRYLDDLEQENNSSAIYSYLIDSIETKYRDNTKKERIVVDFIACMTDNFFNNQFRENFYPQNYGYKLK